MHHRRDSLSLSRYAIVLTHSNAYSADGMPRPIKHESWSADVVKERSSTLPKNGRREEEMTDDSIIVVGGHAATIVAVFVVVVVPSPPSSTTTHAGAEEADDMFDESMIVVLGPFNENFSGGMARPVDGELKFCVRIRELRKSCESLL
jgi:hypothetical protein